MGGRSIKILVGFEETNDSEPGCEKKRMFG